jgi:hypothetical protein
MVAASEVPNSTAQVAAIVQSGIIDNWVSRDEPPHLRTIRDRLLVNEQRASRLLGVYRQVLQDGGVSADDSAEQIELLLSGLVVKQAGYLRPYNRIYQEIFDGSIHFWKIYRFGEKIREKQKCRVATMNQDKQERLQACLEELATLLYEEADPGKLTDLEGIEKTVRSQILELVSPEIALFLSNKKLKPK